MDNSHKGYSRDAPIIKLTENQLVYPDETNVYPRHGDNIASKKYAPPILIYFPYEAKLPVLVDSDWEVYYDLDSNRFTSGNPPIDAKKFRFDQNPPSHNLFDYLKEQFIFQYQVSNVVVNGNEIRCSKDSFDFQTFVVIQTNPDKIPNMLVHNEIYGTRNYIEKTLLTYQISNINFIPIGNFDSDAGFYFTIRDYDIVYSESEFHIPNQGYLLDDDTIIDKETTMEIFNSIGNSGMDSGKKFRVKAETTDFGHIYYTNSSLFKFFPICSEKEIFISKPNLLKSCVSTFDLTFKQSQCSSHEVNLNFNIPIQGRILYIDDVKMNILVNGEIFTILKDESSTISANDYLYELNNNSISLKINNITVETLTYEVKPDFNCRITVVFPSFYKNSTLNYHNGEQNYLINNFDSITAMRSTNEFLINHNMNQVISYFLTSSEQLTISTCFEESDNVFIRFTQLDDPKYESNGNFWIVAKKVFIYPYGSIQIDVGDKISDGSYLNTIGQTVVIQDSKVDPRLFPIEMLKYRFEARESNTEIAEYQKFELTLEELITRIRNMEISNIIENINFDIEYEVQNSKLKIKNLIKKNQNLRSSLKLRTPETSYLFIVGILDF